MVPILDRNLFSLAHNGSPMVTVLMVKTAAIRIAYRRSSSEVIWRPRASVSGLGAAADPAATSAISPPAKAAPTNSMATNSRPLPRKTDAKNRSSRRPIRSRTTPMNHKKAIPANGTRSNAIAKVARRAGSASHTPASAVSDGVETIMRMRARPSSAEKRIPATAAALVSWDGFRCLRWSGWGVREGDDGRGDPGGGVRASCAGEGAGALGLAGPVPVPVDDGAVFREFAGQRRAAGHPGADRGGHGAAGAAVGDLAGLDAHPGAAPLPGGGGSERGGAGGAAGHLVPGGPGGEFLPDQARAARAEHRPGRRAGAVQARLHFPQRGLRPVPPPSIQCREL